jgi:hypothetical protein
MVTQWKYVFGVHIRIYVSLSMFRQLDWSAAESGFKHEALGVVASLPRRELSNEPMSSLKKSVLLGEVTDPRHGLECFGGQALPSNKFHALSGFGDLPVKADLFVEFIIGAMVDSCLVGGAEIQWGVRCRCPPRRRANRGGGTS